MVGGCSKDDRRNLSKGPHEQANETEMNESIFPLYEDRSVRPNHFEFRKNRTHQSLGIKLTVTDLSKKPPLQRENETKELFLFPEARIDEFELFVDGKAWTRIARFALNLDYDGYDSRWWTGDYEQNVASEMLIHPTTAFAMEGFLQVSNSQIRDMTHFLPSFENFKTAIHMANLIVRVPAVSDDKIMLCDVVIRCDEITINFSHDLPRTPVENQTKSVQFSLSNHSSNGEPTQQTELDVALDDTTSNKNVSFGFHLLVVGLSLTAIPIISFLPSCKSEQLLLPTNVEMLLRLEVKALRDVWTGIEASFLVAAHQCEVNLDLELLAVALTTVFLHYKILADVIDESMSHLCSQNAVVDELQRNESLVERVDQCWKNGKMCINVSLSVESLRICMWRQNVPRHQPMNTKATQVIEMSPLLMIADFILVDVSLRINIRKNANQRRTLGNLSAQKLSLACCDFYRLLSLDTFWMEIHEQISLEHGLSYAENPMVEIFSIGATDGNFRGVNVRLQEESGQTCLFTFAAHFIDGRIGIDGETISTFALLIIDPLLVAFPMLRMNSSTSRLTSDGTSNGGMSIANIKSERVLEWYNTVILKLPVDILQVRVGCKNVQILLSDRRSTDECFTVELFDSSMILSYLSRSHNNTRMVDLCATEQSHLSSLVAEKKYGFHHELKSRQRIQFCKSDCDMTSLQLDEDGLIDAFDFLYTNCRGDVAISTSDEFKALPMQKLINCFVALQRLFRHYEETIRPRAEALLYKLNKRSRDCTPQKYQDNLSSPIYHVCSSTAAALASLKDISSVMNEKINSLIMVSENFKLEKDDEIAKLRVRLMMKENQRLKAHTLVSSEATGWLRLGISQRSGPQNSITCTLWHHWVILRRSVLLLFACPGQVRM